MFDCLLSEKTRQIRDEARDLVKWVPRQMIIDMDNEVMSMIEAHEWYREYFNRKKAGAEIRDYEGDAAESGAPEEKIYE